MKKYSMIFAALLAATVLSCSREAADVSPVDGEEGEEVILMAGFGDDTRTIRQSDGKVFWSVKDEISVVRGTRNKKFTSTNTAPAAEAGFKGTMPAGSGAFWAVHPYTKRLFFCFTSPTAVLKLPDGFKVEKVNALTSLFQLYRRAKLQKVFSISDGGELRISPGHEYVVGEAFVAIPVGSSDDTKSSARGAKAPKKQLAD